MAEEKPMDLKNDKPAVEILFMAYNVVLAGFWVLQAAEEPVTPIMAFLHVGLAFLLLGMARIGKGSRLPLRILNRLFPYLMWTLAWSEIGWLYGLTLPMTHDGGVMAVDLAVFGFHLNEELSSFLPWGWVRNVMGFSYLSYYLLIILPPLALAVRKQERDLAHHTFGLMSTYLACFLFYLAMPVLGPRDLAHAAGEIAPGVGGLFGPVINAFFESGDSLGTAFPSSHCAGSVASALLVRRHFGPATGRLALSWAGFIVVSTVYTNNHYTIDAVAGVAIAVLIQKAIIPNLSRTKDRKFVSARCYPSAGINLSHRSESVKKGGLS
jgi:membrane-associated phospholipid phosphatase